MLHQTKHYEVSHSEAGVHVRLPALRWVLSSAVLNGGLAKADHILNLRVEKNPEGEKGIKIPQRALLVDQDGTYVLTVDEAGTVGVARVETGDRVGPDVVILSGLTPGTRVVTDGVQKAMPGATVQVVSAEG